MKDARVISGLKIAVLASTCFRASEIKSIARTEISIDLTTNLMPDWSIDTFKRADLKYSSPFAILFRNFFPHIKERHRRMFKQLLYVSSCYLRLVGGIRIRSKQIARFAPKPVYDNTGVLR